MVIKGNHSGEGAMQDPRLFRQKLCLHFLALNNIPIENFFVSKLTK